MKKFLIKGIIFLCVLLGFAFLLQTVCDKGLRKANNDSWNDIFSSKINADMVFLGSSRAQNCLSPAIFDSAFKLNSFNLGLRAAHYHMQYYRFLLYLKYCKHPKYIIQNIDPYTLRKQENVINYVDILPYFQNDLIQKDVSTFGSFDWRDFYIPFYKYVSNYNAAYDGLRYALLKTPLPKDYKGYYSVSKTGKMDVVSYHSNVDTTQLNMFVSFLNICKTEKIPVIFVYAPIYYKQYRLLTNGDSIMSIYKNYATLYHIPYLDYSNDSISQDTTYFADANHLNQLGVIRYNKKLCSDLKSIIK